MIMLYRNFDTQEQIDAEYDPARISDRDGAMERFAQLSAAAVEAMPNWYSRQFGISDAEYVDIFPSGVAGAPVHIFVHGGYWRALRARQFAFIAQTLASRGITVVLSNYGLCPDVRLGDIVDQTREAVAWVARNTSELDIDINRLTVSGHSAGGHLVGMLLATDWTTYGLSKDLIKGAIALSGLFDLGPFPHSWLQSSLHLIDEDVTQFSPLFLPVHTGAKVVLRYGGLEQSEFARQSKTYADYLTSQGLSVECQPLDGADHFTILNPFIGEDSEFVRLIQQLSN